MRICKHIFSTNFIVLSPHAKLLWIYAACHANHEGVVDIHIDILPRLAGLHEGEAEGALEELSRNNFYNDDSPPFLSQFDENDWCVSKIHPWHCRTCEVRAREFICPTLREEVLAIGFCAHCKSTENLEVDHIRPVSLGGSSERDNLQALCRTCNRSKLNRFVG